MSSTKIIIEDIGKDINDVKENLQELKKELWKHIPNGSYMDNKNKIRIIRHGDSSTKMINVFYHDDDPLIGWVQDSALTFNMFVDFWNILADSVNEIISNIKNTEFKEISLIIKGEK